MAQEYVGISEMIKRSHALFNALPCMEFDYSLDNWLGVWYAEERLYIVHDPMIDAYYFIKANSPKDAIDKVNKRCEEASNAGKYVDESEEW